MFCLRNATASHFADDTCLTYANSKLKTLKSNFETSRRMVKSQLTFLMLKKTYARPLQI